MRIAIITHYYKSTNYGGNLQAYALSRYLNNKGHEASLLCFSNTEKRSKRKFTIKKVFCFIIRVITKAIYYLNQKSIAPLLEERKQVVLDFNQNEIPHSKEIYTSETIELAENNYDVFITGSDQVWNPYAVNNAYLLNFVQKKPKLSYAASLAVSELSFEYKCRLQEALKDYLAVSVRERNAVPLLNDVATVAVENCVDPVFLLDKSEWVNITSKEVFNRPYIFCYFLGDNNKARKLVSEYSRKTALPILTLPYLEGRYRRCDKLFGDKKMYDVSPQRFLSLIANADVVFTDSFHAVAFSLIFQKQFYVFNRRKNGDMSDRIYSILELFGVPERFCNSTEQQTLNYLETCQKIDYDKDFKDFATLKEKSKDYLFENLKKAEEIVNARN